MTEAQVRVLLNRKVAEAGSLRAFCREHELDPTFVSRVQHGEPLTPAILKALKVERIVSYRRIK